MSGINMAWVLGGMVALVVVLTFISAYIDSREIIEEEKKKKK
jgi:hypothetical protein